MMKIDRVILKGFRNYKDATINFNNNTLIIGENDVGKTNLIYALGRENSNIGNIRETFFYNQMRVKQDIISSKISDFQIGERTFEIGGKNKGQQQITGAKEGYIVKDDIETGYGNIIPLWNFGMNY